MSAADLSIVALFLALFFGMLGAYRLGRRLGKIHRARNPGGADGSSAIDGALFALLGLLVAFTFAGAASRFDKRRELIVDEANAISTAYLRLDLLPAAAQPELRAEFRRYVDARLRYYRSLGEPSEAARLKREAEALQHSIWKQAVTAAAATHQPAPMMQTTTALNAMIDATSTRAMSLITHPPVAIYVMLGLLALVCAVLAGFGSAPLERPSRFHVYGFATIVTLTVYLTLDLEFPRHGLIRVDAADALLIDARRAMK